MILTMPTMTIPLKTDKHGRILVSGTRVTLDSIIGFYLQGESPEELHKGFPTVPLADIYAVIAYYLAHREEVDAYLQARYEEAERVRQEIEASYTPEQKARLEYFRALADQKREANER
jgi:uncharacterized protein (DUF433 family)